MVSRPTPIDICLRLTSAISAAPSVDEIYEAALDALTEGLGVSRASILLFDPAGVMRFKASRGLSEAYRRAVEGHTPWTPDSPDPAPIVVPDVEGDASLGPFLPTIRAEGIAAMAFIPLVSQRRVIGKFMLYEDAPRARGPDEMQLAGVIAAQVAFAVARTRAEEHARRSEERLRFALDAAQMGTWDWDVTADTVRWSDNLERIHGLPAGTLGGTFASYEREIHPEDRERVLASVRRAMAEGVPHDVEYRIVAPDGTVRWVECKGRVEYEGTRPVRMAGVCVIVTRRKEAESARLSSLEETGRLKDEFLATLSHELRTPMNAILGWAQILEANAPSPERLRRALDVIGRNARLQAQLIEDILDVSRVISGKLEIERVPVLVQQLIETVVGTILPAGEVRRVRVDAEASEPVPPIEGDPKRLLQVLGNVLSNAVKFTPEGGAVRIRCFGRDGSVIVEVRDTGVGIDPAFLPFVFDRFRQADSRSTRRHGGLGLGLAIARHIVEQHQGDITAASEGGGRGTTVVIRLPALVDPAVAAATGRPSDADDAAPVRLDGALVLVVDDERDSRDLVAALLEGLGAQVLQCDSAGAAFDVVGARAVDLLVADLAMPEVDGYGLIERIRRTHPALPALAVSAYARPEDRRRALSCGFNGYCPKPLAAGEFVRLVRDSLPGWSPPASASIRDGSTSSAITPA
jgi:PAS domain S-box-containing protein